MITLITIIGCACFGAMIMNFEPYQKLLRWADLDDVKPFSCTMCMTFWVTLPYWVATTQSISSIFLAAASSVLAEFIDRKLNDF